MIMRQRVWSAVATTTVLFGAGVYAYDVTHSHVVTRGARALATFGYVGIRYARADYGDDKKMAALHEECAALLLRLLQTNKGLYIKIGQAIANQGPLFPHAYQRRFAQLYDDAPADAWLAISTMLDRNYGSNWPFTIEGEVIALALIAQVYQGRLHTGELVAVKVQHPYIDDQLAADLWVYRTVASFYGWIFDMPFAMFTRYILDQISQETNFLNEALNGDRLKRAVAADGLAHLVHIPFVYRDQSTSQVLVAEWIDGVLVTETESVSQNYNVNQMMNTFLQVFGRQIFNYGFVHSDPHPGNLKVRRFNGRQQLVILDHGLYTDIPPKFGAEYRRLWEKMFVQDVPGIKEIGREWGIESVELFASIISLRPTHIQSKAPRDGTITDDRTVPNLLGEFLEDQLKFPRELLFLTRTQRMMQNMNKQYGLPVNRINVLTKCAIRKSDLSQVTRFRLEISLLVLELMFVAVRMKQWLVGDLWGKKSLGLEDYLEVFMKNTARQVGVEIY